MVKCYEMIKLEMLFLLNKKAFQIYTQPWFKEWLLLRPQDYWEKVQCPVLVINGGKDLQVPAENLNLINKFIKQGGNSQIDTKIFPGMNHLFQPAKKGLPEEYAMINSSISNEVLDFITNWIKKIIA